MEDSFAGTSGGNKLLADDLHLRKRNTAQTGKVEHQLVAAQGDTVDIGRQHGVEPFGFTAVGRLRLEFVGAGRHQIAAGVLAVPDEADAAGGLLAQIESSDQRTGVVVYIDVNVTAARCWP